MHGAADIDPGGRRRRLPLGCAVAMVTTLLTLALLEGTLQLWGAYLRIDSRQRSDGSLVIERDPALGWRPAPRRNLPVEGEGRFTTDARGWRRFETAARRPLLLAIGDSTTHAVGVPDGQVYYDHLAAGLGLAVVALGVNGYGTLQELLVAGSESVPPPDLLLLQMHDNDVINNSLALERHSFRNNNLLWRPYLQPNGEVASADPRRGFEHLVLGRELTRRLLSRALTSIEDRIEGGDPEALALYRRELPATAHALTRLRNRFPGVPAFAFNASGGGTRIGGDLTRLARDAGFHVLEIEPEFSSRAAGRSIHLADGAHWNATGHVLAGEILAARLAAWEERP